MIKMKTAGSKIRTVYAGFAKSLWRRIVLAVISLVPLFLTLFIALYYVWGPAEGYFHSDCTDSLLWANASVESGSVFDSSFRYAGLLPFSGVLWMIPLIKLFGYGMTAQNIGMSIFVLLFVASVYFFCRSAGFGRLWSSSAAAVVTLFMSSSDKLRELLYGHTIYYTVAPLILFALGGCFLLAEKCIEKKKLIGSVIWSLLIAFLCAGAATDGGQVIVLTTLPVLAGVLAERFFDGKEKLFCRRNIFSLGLVLVAGLGTVIGAKLLSIWKGSEIECSYANAYSGWSDISAWVDNAQLFVKHWFSLLGVTTGDGSMFSKDSITVMIRILGGLVLIAAPILVSVFYKRIRNRGVRIAVWAHWVSTAAILFGFICGKLSGVNWRLTPIVASSSLICVMGARELCVCGLELMKKRSEEKQAENEAVLSASAGTAEVAEAEEVPDASDESAETAEAEESLAASDKSDELAEAAEPALTAEQEPENTGKNAGRVLLRLGAAFMCVLILFSAVVFKEIKAMPADYGRDNYKHALANFLVEKNLKYGYATFWYSQVITALTDSRTQCREVLASKGKGVYSDYYQSSRKWYVNQDYENYYVLLSDSEYETVRNTTSWKNWIENYLVASYDSDDGVYVGFVVYVFSVNILDLD